MRSAVLMSVALAGVHAGLLVRRMVLDELMTTARETLTVRRVYGDPIEKDGITVIPAAAVSGGGGGGGGHDDEGPEGEGGGFGLGIKPAGVYVIAEGHVRWRPAVDANRLICATAGAVVGAVHVSWLVRSLADPRRDEPHRSAGNTTETTRAWKGGLDRFDSRNRSTGRQYAGLATLPNLPDGVQHRCSRTIVLGQRPVVVQGDRLDGGGHLEVRSVAADRRLIPRAQVLRTSLIRAHLRARRPRHAEGAFGSSHPTSSPTTDRRTVRPSARHRRSSVGETDAHLRRPSGPSVGGLAVHRPWLESSTEADDRIGAPPQTASASSGR